MSKTSQLKPNVLKGLFIIMFGSLLIHAPFAVAHADARVIACDTLPLEVKDLLIAAAESLSQTGNASPALLECYNTIIANNDTLEVAAVYQAIPDVVNYLSENARAIRPSGPPHANATGINNTDIDAVLSLLNALRSQLRECCSNLAADFDATFSLLENLEITVTGDFLAEFQDTWTILDNLENTVVECCEAIQDNFVSTWTILDNLTVTATTDLTEVFTVLDTITESITTDFAGTWTQLEDIRTTLTTCCQDIQDNFVGTWTILDGLTVTATTDLSEVFTILAELNTTLTNCCTTLETGLDDLLGISATLLVSASIDVPGLFALSADLEAPIVISSSDVTLDLNGHVIGGATNGIIIEPNLERIIIKNGSIIDSLEAGIIIGEGCNTIQLENLVLHDCGSAGAPFAIQVAGTALNLVHNLLIDSVKIVSCASGVQLSHVKDSLIKDSIISVCQNTDNVIGIEIDGDGINSAVANILDNVVINDLISSNSSAIGIVLNGAKAAICNNCIVEFLAATEDAVGVELIGALNAQCNDLIVNDLTSIGIGSLAAGIQVGVGSSGAMLHGTAINNLIGSNNAIGIEVNAPSCLAENTVIDGLSGVNFVAGIHLLSPAINTDIINGSCLNLTGTLVAVGLQIDAANAAIKNNLINNVTAGLTAAGYLSGNAVVGGLFEADQSLNITVTGGVGAVASGFNIAGADIAITKCSSINNNGLTASASAFGFNIIAGAANVGLDLCVTEHNSATTGNGFVLAGDDSAISNCISQFNSNIGFLIDGSDNILQNSQALNSATGVSSVLLNGASIFNNAAAKNTTNFTGVLNIILLGLAAIAGGNLNVL